MTAAQRSKAHRDMVEKRRKEDEAYRARLKARASAKPGEPVTLEDLDLEEDTPSVVPSAKPMSVRRNRPTPGSKKMDDVIKAVKAAPKLQENEWYFGTVTTSCKTIRDGKERYKMTIGLPEIGDVSFGEPFPFNEEFSAIYRMFAENSDLLKRLSDLERQQVEFCVWYNQSSNGKSYMNVQEIVLVTDEVEEEVEESNAEEVEGEDEEEEAEEEDEDFADFFDEDDE